MKFLKNTSILTIIFGISFSSTNAMDFRQLERSVSLVGRGKICGVAMVLGTGYLAYKAPVGPEKTALASIATGFGVGLGGERLWNRIQEAYEETNKIPTSYDIPSYFYWPHKLGCWGVAFLVGYVPIYLAYKRFQTQS